jgi:hypothetical protein
MKKASRHYRIPSYQYEIQLKLLQLKLLLREEIEFGVPCYEDGSLNPKHGLQEIFNRVIELDNLMNQRIDNIRLSQQKIPPPATPESLNDISEAIE